jgi:hypothetical protein
MHREPEPECRSEALLEREDLEPGEDADPDPDHADAEPDREGTDHPAPMHPNVAAADRAVREHERDEEPRRDTAVASDCQAPP